MNYFKELGIEGVYVIHSLSGYELHENRIVEIFGSLQLPFEFVTDGDVSLINEKLKQQYFTDNIALSSGVLSCTLNHLKSYEKIVNRKNNYALVFENDPFFIADFKQGMQNIMEEIQKRKLSNFIVSLENTCMRFPSYFQTRRNQLLYKASSGRAAGAYLLDLEAAENMLNYLNKYKCHTVIDWWHNELIREKKINMYWAHPPLVEQGSHNGFLNSTISSKQRSLARKCSWKMQFFYKYYIKRLINDKRVIS